MTPWGAGRALIALVALVTMVSPTLVDFNDSHIYNPSWSAHAKFHVAHTMLLGLVLGVVALGYLYPGRHSGLAALRAGAWFAAVYWIAQAGSILLPGTAFADPEFADRLPHVAGLTITQPVLDLVFVGIVVTGYILESRRLRAAATAHTPDPAPAGHRDATLRP